MNWIYINRGKRSMEELFEMCDDKLALIKEVKGNPAILEVLDKNSKLLLRIRFSVSNIEKVKMDESPVVFVGKAPFDPLILGAIPQDKAGLKLARKIDTPKKVYVRRKDGWIELEFYFKDVMVFKMRIREGGIVGG
jgi:U3 small nucleolar ribonucleoprotein protein IMP4